MMWVSDFQKPPLVYGSLATGLCYNVGLMAGRHPDKELSVGMTPSVFTSLAVDITVCQFSR